MLARIATALACAGALSACDPVAEPVGRAETADMPVYNGVETRLLDGDLVNFLVSLSGTEARIAVERYAECAAARYTLIRGYGFARHVRTNVSEEAGIWRADAVYTISPALPRGIGQIDAEVVAENCAREGIPTV